MQRDQRIRQEKYPHVPQPFFVARRRVSRGSKPQRPVAAILAGAVAACMVSSAYATVSTTGSALANAWPTFGTAPSPGAPAVVTYADPSLPSGATAVGENFSSGRGVSQTFTATSDFTLGA